MAEIVLTDKDINQFGFAICGTGFASSLEPVIENGSSSNSGSNSGVEIKDAGSGVYDTKKVFTPNMPVAGLRAFDMTEKNIDNKKEDIEKAGTEQAD